MRSHRRFLHNMTTIATNKYEFGDVDLTTCTLTTIPSGNQVNITGQVAEISLFEDIEKPALYCEVLMRDAIGLLKTFPIVGEEWFDISFTTPGKDAYTARFHVFNIEGIQGNPQQTQQVYTLKCVSEETYISASTLVEKGYNDTIANIIADILSNKLNSAKKFFYEPTKGPQQIVFTRRNPWDSIDMVRKRACSANNQSSSYFFFENKYGFNFNTLEYLMVANANNIGDKIFTRYTALSSDSTSQLGFRNIMDYKQGAQFDMMKSIHSGALNNVHQNFDIVKKVVANNSYNLSQFSSFGTADASGGVSPFTSYNYQTYGSNPTTIFYSIEDSGKPETFIPDFLSKKIGYLSTQMMGSLDILVNGDSSISIGDIITIEVPKSNALTRTGIDPEPLVGGNYLVAKARHVIQVSMSKPKYTLYMTLIRGTYTQ
jgi:hypothetical protein